MESEKDVSKSGCANCMNEMDTTVDVSLSGKDSCEVLNDSFEEDETVEKCKENEIKTVEKVEKECNNMDKIPQAEDTVPVVIEEDKTDKETTRSECKGHCADADMVVSDMDLTLDNLEISNIPTESPNDTVDSDFINCTDDVDFTVDSTNDFSTLKVSPSKDVKSEDTGSSIANAETDIVNEDQEKISVDNDNMSNNRGSGDALVVTETSGAEEESNASSLGPRIKKYRVKLPMKGEKFLVKVVDSVHVPHKLFLKNTDKVEKRKLNMLLAKKILEPLTNMPLAQLEERSYVLVKIGQPAKLLRAQVKCIVDAQTIDVQDIDSGCLYRATSQDIYLLDDEQIANIYPRLFICTLSEFDGKDIYWNSMIRDLYLSTLRYGQVSIEVKAFHQASQTYEVNFKLLLDDKKFINLNEWLGNSLIPYLTSLKTCPASQLAFVKHPPEDVFFPYVKLLKE